MADEPDVAPVFRNDFEARAPDIVALLDAMVPPRFQHLRSFDYSVPGEMTFTGTDIGGGPPMVFLMEIPSKVSKKYVDRELPKAIAAFDSGI